MAKESFLINPAKGYRKGKTKRVRRKRNTWFGESKRHAKAAKVGWAKRKRSIPTLRKVHRKIIKRRKRNPFGTEVLLVGNPRKRKRSRSRRRKVASKAIFSMNRKRRVHHRRRKSYAMNPVRHRRRSIRRRHRNPASSSGRSMSMKNMIMPIAVGVGAYYATQSIPTMLGMTSGITRLGVQAGIGIGGAMLLKKMVGRENAMIFGVVSGALVVISLLNQYVFTSSTAVAATPAVAVSGFGAFNPGQRIPNMSRRPLIPLSRPIMSIGSGFSDSPAGDSRYQY